ncbi:MAG: T6SS immunity protein Tli4 family protein [Telluria sp.]
MKRHFKSKWFKGLAALAAVVATAWSVGAVMDKHEVAKMTEKMQIVCVGRMLIDLPQEADYALYGAWIHGFDIETVQESSEAFARRVAARETEIRAKPDYLGGNKNMESAKDVKTGSGLTGKIFVHTRNVTEGTAAKGLELEHFRYEGVALEGHVHGHGISISLTADDYDPDKLGNLPNLIEKLVANPDNRLTTEPGFCLDRAYVRDPLLADQGERIRLTAGLPSHRDIEIHIDTTAGTKPAAQGLIERNAENSKDDPPEYAMRFTRLRAAPRTIGSLTGDELLLRVVEENFAIIYGFRWEVLGTENDVFVPDMGLKMVTGRSKDGPIPSSLSQASVLDLWDKIASSIRVRPTVAPKVSVAEPTPLGSQAMAGDTCIQSGWWECNEGGNGTRVHGGQRQFIRQGERMPQALLLPPQTLWEKARGLQPSHEATSPTPWTLVDRRSRRRIAPDVPLAQPGAPISAAAAPIGGGAIEQVSVGTYAITGNVCPATGWWACQESDTLDGTRWFARGSLLPAATFVVPERTFGKTSACPKVIQRRGIWQLVRLATI